MELIMLIFNNSCTIFLTSSVSHPNLMNCNSNIFDCIYEVRNFDIITIALLSITKYYKEQIKQNEKKIKKSYKNQIYSKIHYKSMMNKAKQNSKIMYNCL